MQNLSQEIWFDYGKIWDSLLQNVQPKRILEIGCYDGGTTCSLIARLEDECEIHCVDPWHDYDEPNGENMAEVENNFDKNISLALEKKASLIKVMKHKEKSESCLPKFLVEGKKNFFDLIYIDGSHMASDVLFDAVISFHLCRIDGVIIFDDYLWSPIFKFQNGALGKNLSMSPKPAIDAFTSIYWDKLDIKAAHYQVFVQKISN